MKISQTLAQSAQQLMSDLSLNKQTSEVKQDVATGALDLSQFSTVAKQAIELVSDLGVDVSQEEAQVIAEFMDQTPGTTAEKLMALSTVIDKQLPLSGQLIGDLHTARSVSMADFLDDSKGRAPVSGASTHLRPVAESSRKVAVSQLDTLMQKLFSDNDNDEHQVYANATKPQKNQSHEQVTNDRANDVELAAIDQLVGDLAAIIDQELSDDQWQVVAEQLATTLGEVKSPVDSPVNTPATMLLETTVTPKLAQVKADFDTFKQVTKQSLAQLVDKAKPMSREQRIQQLNKVIDRLDNAIMKSEIGLYIDMKSERELLKQSSTLAKARTLLSQGKLSDSEAIVSQVVHVIDTMTFKPTIQKAVAVGSSMNLSADDLHYNDIIKYAKATVEQFSGSDKSVASLTHYLRRLGINHEAEVFQQVFGKSDKSEQVPQKSLHNLKAMLLSLDKQSQSTNELHESSKLLSAVNGQQIHMKVADKTATQQLMLSVPMSMDGHIADVKVFIKSQEHDFKVDWQNFNMFFVLDTRRFGDVGIKVAAVDKQLRIDIHNNRHESAAIIEPLADHLKGYVEDIGYRVMGLKLSAWGDEHPNRKKTKAHVKPVQSVSQSPEKGFDFTI